MLITIHPAKQDDYHDFISIFRDIEQMHREALPRKYQKPESLIIQQEFENILANPQSKILMAKIENKAIGYILAYQKQAPEKSILKPRSYLEVDTLCVLAEYRKSGVGMLLLDALENWAKEQNILDIQLTVWTFNQSAIHFYQKNDYQILNHQMRKILK